MYLHRTDGGSAEGIATPQASSCQSSQHRYMFPLFIVNERELVRQEQFHGTGATCSEHTSEVRLCTTRGIKREAN